MVEHPRILHIRGIRSKLTSGSERWAEKVEAELPSSIGIESTIRAEKMALFANINDTLRNFGR